MFDRQFQLSFQTLIVFVFCLAGITLLSYFGWIVLPAIFIIFVLIGVLVRTRRTGLDIAEFPLDEKRATIEIAGQPNTRYADELPIAVLTLYEDGRIRFLNLATCELLGVTQAEQLQFSDLVEGLGRPVSTWIDEVRTCSKGKNVEFASAKRSKEETYLQIQLIKLSLIHI